MGVELVSQNQPPAAARQTAQAPAAAPAIRELLLPGMTEALAMVGAETVPEGFSRLMRRQKTFVLEYLRTGNQTEAARIAGYSTPSADGSKVMKKPAVMSVLRYAGREVAKNADQLVRRVSERSRTLHALYEAERDKPATLRSDSAMLKIAAQVDRTDALLGQLIGKINGLHLSGTILHDHTSLAVTIPDTALPALAQLRREVIGARETMALRN